MSKSILTLFVAVALVSAAALGDDKTWIHVDPDDVLEGEWSDASNWDTGVPGAGDDAYLTSTDGSYVVNVNDVVSNLGVLWLENTGGQTVTLNINADLGTAANWAHLYMLQGSVINVNGTVQLGLEPTTISGKVVVNDGGTL